MSKTIENLSCPPLRHISSHDTVRLIPSKAQPIRVLARQMESTIQVMPHHHVWGQIVFSDSGTIKVNTPLVTYLIPPKHGVWIPPNVVHAAVLLAHAKLISIYMHAPASDKILNNPTYWQQPSGANCRVFTVSPLLYELVTNLNEYHDDPNSHRYSALCTLIWGELERAETLSLGVAMPEDKRLKALCDTFLMEPSSKVTLCKLSQKVGLSLSTASRLFQKQLGMGFNQWKQQALLAQAIALSAQQMAINQIAYELGYANPSAFSAMVKNVVGVSPKVFFYQHLSV